MLIDYIEAAMRLAKYELLPEHEGFVGRIPARVVQCIATTLRRGDYSPQMKTRPVYHIHRFDPAPDPSKAGWVTPGQSSVRNDGAGRLQRNSLMT